MPKNIKKAAAKSASPDVAAAAQEQEEKKRPSSSTPPKRRSRDEINEIFASKKKQKKPAMPKKPAKDAAAAMRKSDGRNKSKKDSTRENGSDPPAAAAGRRPRKSTGDGLAIYTEEELGVGKADAGARTATYAGHSTSLQSTCDENDLDLCITNYKKGQGIRATEVYLNCLEAITSYFRAKTCTNMSGPYGSAHCPTDCEDQITKSMDLLLALTVLLPGISEEVGGITPGSRTIEAYLKCLEAISIHLIILSPLAPTNCEDPFEKCIDLLALIMLCLDLSEAGQVAQGKRAIKSYLDCLMAMTSYLTARNRNIMSRSYVRPPSYSV